LPSACRGCGEPSARHAYDGKAEPSHDAWIAPRANVRAVLEKVTLADVATGRLSKPVVALAREPTAWTSG